MSCCIQQKHKYLIQQYLDKISEIFIKLHPLSLKEEYEIERFESRNYMRLEDFVSCAV